MHSWAEMLHAQSPQFPPLLTALKLGVALMIGLLIGFERQWSQKDFGVRTFSLTALLGALTALMAMPILLLSLTAVIVLAALLNLRDILSSRSIEGTTSLALIVTFVVGTLSGEGHIFVATASGIVATWLLSLKPQFRAFAGGVKPQEIRSALLLGLFGFVIWPLLPDRYIDPWQLLQPREAWITILIVSCISFVNYILLRLYGTKGITLTAVLGGLVNSTAAVSELATTLPAAGLLSQTVSAVLLTTVAMFLRNFILLLIFARDAAAFALGPLLLMSFATAWFVWHNHRPGDEEKNMKLELSSPVSLEKVFRFGGLFLLIQILGTAAHRWMGTAGLIVVSILGGAVSSASTTAAAANMASHGDVSVLRAGIATVVTSIVSSAVDLPILWRMRIAKPVFRQITVATILQTVIGIGTVLLELHFIRR